MRSLRYKGKGGRIRTISKKTMIGKRVLEAVRPRR